MSAALGIVVSVGLVGAGCFLLALRIRTIYYERNPLALLTVVGAILAVSGFAFETNSAGNWFSLDLHLPIGGWVLSALELTGLAAMVLGEAVLYVFEFTPGYSLTSQLPVARESDLDDLV